MPNKEGFDLMNFYGEHKIPFFFLVDFLKENIEIYTQEELKKTGILFDFQGFRNFLPPRNFSKKNVNLRSFPFSLSEYEKGFDWVKKNIAQGNSYLVNFTGKTPIEIDWTLEEIFYGAEAKYKVFYPEKFVFFSPEIFIKIENQTISTFPMKGTIEANLPNAQEILKNNPKEKAEHYTVVDLLRNDLSMVAHSVEVKEFQKIDLIQNKQKNLFTMSSHIQGVLKEKYQNQIGTILDKMLPAGSILGAPKNKTLEIILQAEIFPRDYYTGVCGFFDGENLNSCVMIRMIEKNSQGQYFFRSGGGITHQSVLEQEYEELKNKIYVPIY